MNTAIYEHLLRYARVLADAVLQARRFAKAMRASLIFSSTSHSINVQKVRAATRSSTSIFVFLVLFPLLSPD